VCRNVLLRDTLAASFTAEMTSKAAWLLCVSLVEQRCYTKPVAVEASVLLSFFIGLVHFD
jgi:hypothetical protein